MKMLVVSCCWVVLLLSVLSPTTAIWFPSSKPAPCSTTGVVCAELGQTNLCRKFRNKCDMDTTNSIIVNAQFHAVGANICQSISVGQGILCDPDFRKKLYPVTATDCTTTNNVCAKMGNKNIYRKFANECRMQQGSCRIRNVNYIKSCDTYCEGLAVNDQKIVPQIKNAVVCAELGKTNLCKKFSTKCDMDIKNSNLVSDQYHVVDAKICQDILVDGITLCDPNYVHVPKIVPQDKIF